ncbi:MAG TPA: hypothetical protein ENO23_05155 [Alphaproteobacteria bacterium]|nr:hypothetical protein [Alphaproteobacteria bacterium]
MSGLPRPHPLDRPAARLAAVAVALAAAALLAWIHRDDILPPDPAAAPASPEEAAFRACFEPRAADIAASLDRGELDAGQAELFRGRAEAFCRATAGGGGGTGPGLPGLPPR